MPEIPDILRTLDSNPDSPAALATLVTVSGSSYRRPGARSLILPGGTRTGSVSGGCLEEDVGERAQRVIGSGRPELATYDTTSENDLVWGVGLGCQGVVGVFIERLEARRPAWVRTVARNLAERRPTLLVVEFGGNSPRGTRLADHNEAAPAGVAFRDTVAAPPSLVVFGAGDDARPLVRMAKALGWHVTVADARPGYANANRFPEADSIVAAPAAQLAGRVRFDDATFPVVMTHRFADDGEILRALLPLPLRYLGALGPRARTERLLSRIGGEGAPIDPALLDKLHGPVGLDLGGATPETVALSILAEIQSRLANRPATPLRDRPGPIH